MPWLYIGTHQGLLRLRSQLLLEGGRGEREGTGTGCNAMRSFVIVPSNYNARLLSGKCVSLYMLIYRVLQGGKTREGDYNYRVASEAAWKLN